MNLSGEGIEVMLIKRFVLVLMLTSFCALKVNAQSMESTDQDLNSQACLDQVILNPSEQALVEAICSGAIAGNLVIGDPLLALLNQAFTQFLTNLIKFSSALRQATTPGIFGNHINIENSGGNTGLNAGTTFEEILGGLTVWGSLTHNSVENDLTSTSWDSDTNNLMVGAHASLNENMILGGSFGYQSTDVDTFFNGGEQDIDGYTFAGYFGWLVNDWISFDVAGGLSFSETDQERRVSAFEVATGGTFAPLGAGAVVTSDIDSDTWFVSTNLTAFKTYDRWVVDGHIGYLRSETDQDASTESGGGLSQSIAGRNSDFGQLRIGTNIGYQWRDNMEPFVGVDYINDLTFEKVRVAAGQVQPANDDDEIQATAGFRYFGESLSGILQFRNSFGRDDIDNFSIEAVISAEY